jgi:lipopolysaccharide export system permease protein
MASVVKQEIRALIIFRYLSKEILTTFFGVSIVLLLIVMSGRFIKYLAKAAAGGLNPDFLFAIIAYRIPGFLELILPLAVFISILLGYGRLYIDHEMAVLNACGISDRRILGYAMLPGIFLALLLAAISVWVSPWGANKVERLFDELDNMNEFDALVAGRFQEHGTGRVTYTESLAEDKTQMQKVFILQPERGGSKQGLTMLIAEKGSMRTRNEGRDRYLVLSNGYRYDGAPGHPDLRAISYDTYGVLLPKDEIREESSKVKAIPSSKLVGAGTSKEVAELQWRIALPFLVPIVVLLAVPLSRVNPRQGRFKQLLPALLIYMVYLGALLGVKGAMEDGKVAFMPGLWGIHLIFLVVALGLIFHPWLVSKYRQR